MEIEERAEFWKRVRDKTAAGEPLTAEEQKTVDDEEVQRQQRVVQYKAERAELRTGDSARARFYRLKDERLLKVGPILKAIHAYHQKKRASADDKPFADENAEAVLRAYSLLRWTMKALDEDEDDEEALEISRQCFDMMAPLVAAFIPRWT